MAAIDDATRPLPSARRSQMSDDEEEEAAEAVQRTLNQTTSGIFIDTGKKVALTTQRKVPMPKIFRTKSSDGNNASGGFPKADPSTAKWSCAQCRYENMEDGNPVCCLCGSSRKVAESAPSRTTSAMARPTQISSPAQIPSPPVVPIVPMNPFDVIYDNSLGQANTSTNTNDAHRMQQRHSFDDSWFTQAPVTRSRVNSTDSHSLPDEIAPAEPKKPPRRRNKSTENLPMFQSPDYLPPIQVTTRLNGNGGPTSSMSKPTRTARRFLFGRRRASTS